MYDFLKKLKNNDLPQETQYTPLHKEYECPAVNYREAMRYAGIPAAYYKGQAERDSEYIDKLKSRCRNCTDKCEFMVGPDADANANANAKAKADAKAHANANANARPACETEDEELGKLLEDVVSFTLKELTYRVSYCCMPLTFDDEGFPILPFEQHSENLRKNLEGCRGVILFAATVGAGIDRLIRRYERLSPARSLMLQGLGAERVESLCDLFNDEVTKCAAEVGLKTHPRYSPGYGDLPITVQPTLLQLLNAEKRLGITINDSFLMAPSKSVTAIIGIE